MVHNTIQTRVTEVAPEARGSAVALHAFHFYVGQSLGPVAVGAASGLFGAGAAFALAGLGIDYDAMIDDLESEGVSKFMASWDELTDTVQTSLREVSGS